MSTNQEYFCIAAEGEIMFGRMVVVISPFHVRREKALVDCG
jgi:hypothetical protein